MTSPDFIIIGAMKCGTTTLAAQLGAQPGLFMTDPKEPNYFSDDDVFARGPDWYAALFKEAPIQALKGEASTHYTKLPDYPETLARMTARLPHVRLVYMVRNPFDRIVSHYMHSWSMNETDGTLEDTIQTTPRLVEYSLYGKQIAPFIVTYGADAVLLTSLERLKASPTEELRRIATHIGYSSEAIWQNDLQAQNVSAERMRKLPFQRVLLDNPIARGLRRTLIPKTLRTSIRNTRLMQDRPEITQTTVSALTPQFRQDRELLEQFFPDDPSLDLIYPM